MDDKDFWHTTDPDDLWLFDKLILSKKLGYVCGPAGVAPPKPATYIVRPCVNYRMMSKGAKFMHLSPDMHNDVPDGYFWCEIFAGRHLSFDYHFGQQTLAVEGFRDDPARLDRFCMWKKTNDTYVLPIVIEDIAKKYEWVNIEVVGGKIIEVHLRFNDDFANHNSDTIIPVWSDQVLPQLENTRWYNSPCGERLGFLINE